MVPLLAILILDQGTKQLALGLGESVRYGFLELQLHRNPGFMLGTLGDLSKLFTVVAPATFGALLLFVFIVLQDFLPIQSPGLRVGASIFVGGVLGNIVDRLRTGDVVDFLVIHTPFGSTGIFNVADAWQWVGVGLAFGAYLANGRLLYPVDQRRGRKWIDPTFQLKYCGIMIAVGAGFALIGGVLSYTFLATTLGEIRTLSPEGAQRIVSTFLMVYGGAAAAFFTLLAVIGVHLSHRIVGPIKGFENFLDDVIRGSTREFRLRKGDDLRQLEGMAERFHALFHDRLGIAAAGLAAGDALPEFVAETSTRGRIDAASLAGKRIWMIFYRYATCPLCAVHLDDIKETVRKVQAAGVQVLAVYESKVEEFEKAGFEATLSLLKSMGIPLVADPERRLYRAFRTRRNVWSLVKPQVLSTFFKAFGRRFFQGAIEGAAGQLPAHFLVNEQSVIVRAFYGDSAVDHIELDEVRRFAGIG